MGVNSLPKTVTRQRRDCDLNPGPSAPESSTLTTRLANTIVHGRTNRSGRPGANNLTNKNFCVIIMSPFLNVK